MITAAAGGSAWPTATSCAGCLHLGLISVLPPTFTLGAPVATRKVPHHGFGQHRVNKGLGCFVPR